MTDCPVDYLHTVFELKRQHCSYPNFLNETICNDIFTHVKLGDTLKCVTEFDIFQLPLIYYAVQMNKNENKKKQFLFIFLHIILEH
jgi:hypothetical protein